MLAFSLKRIKAIESIRKDAVFGYIRNLNMDIPEGIFLICLLFYGIKLHKWDEELFRTIISNLTNTTITQWARSKTKESAFIEPMLECGIHTYKFKIANRETAQFEDTIEIGIWLNFNDNNPIIHDRFDFNENKNIQTGYAFITNGNIRTSIDKYKQFGIECKNGTIIEMTVDLDALSLSFKIDDVDYGKAFDIMSGSYRVAAFLPNRWDSLKLIGNYVYL